MGFNMNHSLLTGERISKYNIPERKTVNDTIYESSLIKDVLNFRQEIRESTELLSEVFGPAVINDETPQITVHIYNGMSSIVDRVVKSIMTIWSSILAKFTDTINAAKMIKESQKDEIENKYSFFQRQQILQKVLKDTPSEQKLITVVDIVPSTDLMDANFPDINILNDEKFCNDVKDIRNISSKKEESSPSLVSAIENNKERLLSKMFKNYPFNPTNVVDSSYNVANKAFGINKYEQVALTRELYGQACDNIDNIDKVITSLEKTQEEYKKIYNGVISTLNSLTEDIKSPIYNPERYNTEYDEKTRRIKDCLERSLNVISSIVSANNTLIIKKLNRIQSINDSSAKIKSTCHMIIANKDIGDNFDSKPESSAIKSDISIKELYSIQDEYSVFTSIMEDALLEESMQDYVYKAINEADENGNNAGGDNGNAGGNDNNQQPAATEPAAAGANNKPEGKNKILSWLGTLFGKLGDILNRFKNRVNEIIINADNNTNRKWWIANREKISNLNISDTKANDWYPYNLDALKQESVYYDFDPTQEYMKSDKAMQDRIIEKLTTNAPKFDEKDSFTEKLNKVYQGGGKVSVENSEGKTLQELGYNHNDAYTFVNDVITDGFGSPYLGGISKDYKKLDEARKEVMNNYDRLASQIKEEAAATPDENKKDEPTNAVNASAMIEDDFRFNLAEHFGLVHTEASFTVGQQTAQSVQDNAPEGDAGKSSKNKVLDDMIRRYFNYSTIAITARMTNAIAAYKQYMNLYKAVYKGAKPAEKENTNNQNHPANNNQQ